MFKHLLVIHTDDSTDNCQNDYGRDVQLGPSNYRPSPGFPPPVPPLSYCQDDGDDDSKYSLVIKADCLRNL